MISVSIGPLVDEAGTLPNDSPRQSLSTSPPKMESSVTA
jgi:hypothetical protein